MTNLNFPRRPPRLLAAILIGLTALAGCGGGGDSGSSTGPAVMDARVASSSIRYGQTLVIVIDGSHLDQGVSLSSTLCKNAALSTTAPFVSGATTAYLTCTLSGVGAGQVKVQRASDGAILATVAVTIPVPQVTL